MQVVSNRVGDAKFATKKLTAYAVSLSIYSLIRIYSS